MGVESSVVDAALGWLVQSILGSLLTDRLGAWAREVGLASDARRLENEVRGVEAVLAAARGIVHGNEPLARSIDELRELLYDAEDVLDELDYYRLQRDVQKGNHWAPSTSLGGRTIVTVNDASYSTCQLLWNSKDMFTSWAWKAVDLIKSHAGRKRKRGEEESVQDIIVSFETKCEISRRMNKIASQLCIAGDSVQKALHLETLYCTATPRKCAVSYRPLTTSVLVERKVYGRDEDRDELIAQLTKGKSSDLHVLPIVGNGGVGKTTLARLVYRDQRIRDHFDLLMWVCVSSSFDEVRLTREMLEHICTDSRQDCDKIRSFNVLQELLIDNIRNKRFLLVVDDVWEDKDKNRWSRLLAPLRNSEVIGSMVLATTRSPCVAKMIGILTTVELKGLNDADYWLFFKSCAFGDENHEGHPNLQAIGKQIARILKGYPLAAQSVCAVLRQDLTCEHWCKIQERWADLQTGSDAILPTLKLSYDHLPCYLQRCFSYCSLFPKDHKFDGARLVHAWISQGFVYCKDEGNTVDETGRQYLDRLVDLGFFQKERSYYIMHDLIHELAKMVSTNECATIDGLKSNTIPPTIRHLSIVTYAYDEIVNHNDFPIDTFMRELQKIKSFEKLRTLMFFGHGANSCRNLLQHCQTLFRYTKGLRYMRIHLACAEIDTFWDTIKPLHLRYLEFFIGNASVDRYCWFSGIKPQFGSIPYTKAVPMFYHLQTLDAGNFNLVVPSNMSNLVSLRYIIAGEKTCTRIGNIGKMTSLWELKEFRVQNINGFEIGQLQSMNKLVRLGISQLENVSSKQEATTARLTDKEGLEELCLSWNGSGTSFEPTTATAAGEVLEGLCPNRNIKHIQISGFNGNVFPTWLITNSSVTLLRSLHLENCNQWRTIQLKTISSLGTLKLIKMWNLVEVSFPSLEELALIELPNIERCIGTYKKELASHLYILRMERCAKLREFTLFQSYDCFKAEQKRWFSFLKKLTIKHCPKTMVNSSLEDMQSLKELELVEMPGVKQLSVPYLTKLTLVLLPNLECCTTPNEDRLSCSIEVLHIVKCSKLIRFPLLQISTSQDEQEWLPNTHELTVHDCPCLTVSCPLPPSANWCSEVSVSIRGVSTPAAMEMTKDRSSFTIESTELNVLDAKLLAFNNLAGILNFHIIRCPNLFSVSFQALKKLICLERVEINDCPRLLSPSKMTEEAYSANRQYLPVPFARHLIIESSGTMGELVLPCVRSLEVTIKHCHKVSSSAETCPVEEQTRHLQLLYISPLKETGFTRDAHVLLKIPHPLYTFVKKLHISDCPGLVLFDIKEGFAGFTSLEILIITGSAKLLVSIVGEDNTNQRCLLPQSLKHFEADNLPAKLQPYFPRNHTSLSRFSVWDSPRLMSLDLHYCKNLEVLETYNCKQLSALEGLPYLNSLRILKLARNPNLSTVAGSPNYQDEENNEDQTTSPNLYPSLEWLETDSVYLLSVSFCKYLTALQHLTISSSRSQNRMARLSDEEERGLQQLTSLQELRLLCCDDLLSLPAALHRLSSLKKLHIEFCPWISRLPEGGLPLASMEKLEIRGCGEELSKQCRRVATNKLKVIIDGELVMGVEDQCITPNHSRPSMQLTRSGGSINFPL